MDTLPEGECVYLLHFTQPYKHAQHYIGTTTNLSRRIKQHQKGKGGRLMTVIKEAGIEFQVARVWQGGRELERRLKRWHGANKLCPICKGKTNE